MANYKVEIKEASKELKAKQRIAIKDTTSAIKLDLATLEHDVIIDPDMWAVLNIHNDKSDNADYENYIIVDKSGDKYVTGSASFWSSFQEIAEEMVGEDEPWQVRVYRVESKNYKGKQFLTCAIV